MATPNSKKISKRSLKNESLNSFRKSIRKKVKKDTHHEIPLKPVENKRKPSVLQVFERNNWAESVSDLNSSSLEKEFLPQVVKQKKDQNELHKMEYQDSLKSHSMIELPIKILEKTKAVHQNHKNTGTTVLSVAPNQVSNVKDAAGENSKNPNKHLSSFSGEELFNWVLAPIKAERFFR